MVNYFAEPPEQSNRSVLSDFLKKILSNTSLCYIKILNNLTLQGSLISAQRSSQGLLLGEDW